MSKQEKGTTKNKSLKLQQRLRGPLYEDPETFWKVTTESSQSSKVASNSGSTLSSPKTRSKKGTSNSESDSPNTRTKSILKIKRKNLNKIVRFEMPEVSEKFSAPISQSRNECNPQVTRKERREYFTGYYAPQIVRQLSPSRFEVYPSTSRNQHQRFDYDKTYRNMPTSRYIQGSLPPQLPYSASCPRQCQHHTTGVNLYKTNTLLGSPRYNHEQRSAYQQWNASGQKNSPQIFCNHKITEQSRPNTSSKIKPSIESSTYYAHLDERIPPESYPKCTHPNAGGDFSGTKKDNPVIERKDTRQRKTRSRQTKTARPKIWEEVIIRRAKHPRDGEGLIMIGSNGPEYFCKKKNIPNSFFKNSESSSGQDEGSERVEHRKTYPEDNKSRHQQRIENYEEILNSKVNKYEEAFFENLQHDELRCSSIKSDMHLEEARDNEEMSFLQFTKYPSALLSPLIPKSIQNHTVTQDFKKEVDKLNEIKCNSMTQADFPGQDNGTAFNDLTAGANNANLVSQEEMREEIKKNSLSLSELFLSEPEKRNLNQKAFLQENEIKACFEELVEMKHSISQKASQELEEKSILDETGDDHKELSHRSTDSVTQVFHQESLINSEVKAEMKRNQKLSELMTLKNLSSSFCNKDKFNNLEELKHHILELIDASIIKEVKSTSSLGSISPRVRNSTKVDITTISDLQNEPSCDASAIMTANLKKPIQDKHSVEADHIKRNVSKLTTNHQKTESSVGNETESDMTCDVTGDTKLRESRYIENMKEMRYSHIKNIVSEAKRLKELERLLDKYFSLKI